MRTVLRALAQISMIALLLGSSVGGGLVSVASAQASQADKVRARELYTQGQQLFRQGDFTNAQRSFEDAYRAVPNPVVLLSIAECQVRAEEYGNALATLRQYLKEKPNAPDRAQVESQISNLEAKPGSVSIESTPPGAVIWVDGENTGYLTPNEISIRAGSHAISLTASGYESTEKQVDVAIGSRQRLSLTLTPLAPAVAAEETSSDTPSEPVEEPGDTSSGRHPTPAMWTAGGIAIAGAITGTALGISALKKSSDYDKEPSRDLEKKGNRQALFADVSFGVAIVAGVTTLVLYLTSGHAAEQPSEHAFVIAPELRPNEMGLSGRMRF
jgi:tetratricopeptide (TPR) repeat protein